MSSKIISSTPVFTEKWMHGGLRLGLRENGHTPIMIVVDPNSFNDREEPDNDKYFLPTNDFVKAYLKGLVKANERLHPGKGKEVTEQELNITFGL